MAYGKKSVMYYKADAVQKAFFGPVTPEVPASILQLHPNFTLVADEDALKKVLA